MSLMHLITYLQQAKRPVPLGELSRQVTWSRALVEASLQRYLQRGQVVQTQALCESKACAGCPMACQVSYQWVVEEVDHSAS